MSATAEPLGYRPTPQRTAILAAVRAAHDHPTARELYQRVRAIRPGIGFATVYRTLNLLVEHGEVLELQLGEDAVARYDGNVARHDHVRCTGCGKIGDLRVPLPGDIPDQASTASGYRVDGYELTFLGRCPTCADPAGVHDAPARG